MEENWIAQLKADEETALETIIQHRSGYVYTIIRNFSRGRLSPEQARGSPTPQKRKR